MLNHYNKANDFITWSVNRKSNVGWLCFMAYQPLVI